MERDKSLEMALTQIERQFGKGAIMRLGAADVQPMPAISTGALSLDVALGVGGVPRGRVVEIYGAGEQWQDHPRSARDRRGATQRGHCRLRGR